jgi:hypothetical protein
MSPLLNILVGLLNATINALPWILGGLAIVGVATYGPLGRALRQHLRTGQRDTVLTEAMLAELAETRQLLAEVLERLDATERRLSHPGALPLPKPGVPDAADGVPTPV